MKKDVLALATAYQNHDIGHGDVVMIIDYGSYEGQVVMLAGILIGTTIASLDHNLRKSNTNDFVQYYSLICLNSIIINDILQVL